MHLQHDLNGQYAARVWANYQHIRKVQITYWGLPGVQPVNDVTPSPSSADLEDDEE
jgi:hypothetical protein